MNCPSIDILERLEQGDLPEPELGELLTHLSTCENCLSKLNPDTAAVSHEKVHEDEILAALEFEKFSQEAQWQQ